MTSLQSSTAREMARQLLARRPAGGDDPTAIAAALQGVFTRVSENLRRAVGDDGYNALLARALTRAQAEHPALNGIRRVGDADVHLDGLVARVDTYGLPAVTAAVESLLAALVDILSGLVGADMVMNLLDSSSPPRQLPSDGRPQ